MKLKAPRGYLVILTVLTGLVVPLCTVRNAYAYHPFGSKMLEVALTGSAGGFFDDNILFTKSAKKSDWITELVGGLRATYTGRRQTFDLLVDDQEQLYSRYSTYTNNSQNVRLSYQNELSRYDHLGVKDSFQHYYNPQNFEDAFGRTSGQYGYVTNETDVTYTRDVSEKLSLTATAGGGVNLIDKKVGNDSYEMRAGTSGAYSLSTKWSLLAAYDFSMRTIKNGPQATIHAITGGTRFYFTDRLSWEGVGGIQVADNFSHEIKVRPYFQTSLTGQFDKKTTGVLQFIQRSETTSYSQNMFDQWRVSAEVTRSLTDRLRAAVTGFYGRGEYQSINLKNDLLGVSGSLTYEISRYFQVVASYSFSFNDSNQNTSDYIKNMASVKIVFSF